MLQQQRTSAAANVAAAGKAGGCGGLPTVRICLANGGASGVRGSCSNAHSGATPRCVLEVLRQLAWAAIAQRTPAPVPLRAARRSSQAHETTPVSLAWARQRDGPRDAAGICDALMGCAHQRSHVPTKQWPALQARPLGSPVCPWIRGRNRRYRTTGRPRAARKWRGENSSALRQCYQEFHSSNSQECSASA